jgi:hypothetical protein
LCQPLLLPGFGGRVSTAHQRQAQHQANLDRY